MLYAIGDIHGFRDKLDRALTLIEADGGADAPVVFMGDYVDRGPDAKGVIEQLMAGQAAGKDWTCLIGNHDLMFWRFVTQGIWQDRMIKSGKGWLHFNPVSEQDRQRLRPLAARSVPQAHLDWIAHGPRLHRAAGHIFVHAGIRPDVPLEDQAEEDLVWIREGWIDNTDDHPAPVVHGHTAIDFPRNYGNRINLDGGAGLGRTLVPAVLDGGRWYTRDEAGRTPLDPQ